MNFLMVLAISLGAQAGEVLRFTRATVDPTSSQLQSVKESNEWIVQFSGKAKDAYKQALVAKGFSVLGYLPEDAYVVVGDRTKLAEFQTQNQEVRAIVPYIADFKISSDIKSLTSGRGSEAWVVTTFTREQLPSAYNALKNHFKVLSHEGKSMVVIAERSQLRKMASAPGVEHVQLQPDFKVQYIDMYAEASLMDAPAQNPLDGTESGMKVINFDAAWSKGITGKGQIASYSDTGLDTGDMNSIHPDFKTAVKAGQALGMFGKSWEDPMGHGTHVAGSIAGRGTASNGILKGGAYDAMLVAQSMWSPIMNNLMPPSRLETLFNNAASQGASVHSNSWGGVANPGGYDSFAQQVDEWMFNHPDMLVLFAAGNSGVDDNHDGRIDANSIGTPATAKNCLTVGASENVTKTGGIQVPMNKLRDPSHWSTEPIISSYISDNADGIAMFSSRGPTQDGRIKPEVVAPGTNILSTRSHTKTAEPLWGAYDDNYVWAGGTSMATPITAGATTAARQYVVEKMGVANPSSALMKAVMMHTAVDLYPGQYGEGGASKGQELLTHRPNNDEGFGRVDMAKVVSMGSSTHLVDERAGIATGEEKSYGVKVTSGKILVNLVYNDAPASPNASMTLVNNLDLVLVKPDGSQVAPRDTVNNNEIIELSNLPNGDYKLIVKGTKVAQGINGKQPFALVYTAF
jgi:subtilisin family serine protease